jgi:hypothetical protein
LERNRRSVVREESSNSDGSVKTTNRDTFIINKVVALDRDTREKETDFKRLKIGHIPLRVDKSWDHTLFDKTIILIKGNNALIVNASGDGES